MWPVDPAHGGVDLAILPALRSGMPGLVGIVLRLLALRYQRRDAAPALGHHGGPELGSDAPLGPAGADMAPRAIPAADSGGAAGLDAVTQATDVAVARNAPEDEEVPAVGSASLVRHVTPEVGDGRRLQEERREGAGDAVGRCVALNAALAAIGQGPGSVAEGGHLAFRNIFHTS